MHGQPSAVRWWYESLDRARRQRGAAMDRMGLGPSESPYEAILSQAGMRLRFYGGDASRPVVLIVPAPIKRHYIWDLSPRRSVVRRCLEGGLRVYLVEWTEPSGDSAAFGLDHYAGSLIDRCFDAIFDAVPARPVFLLSHSLGGVFAAIYSALRPERVAGLASLEAPLHFAEASGSFLPLLAFGPRAASVTRWFDAVPGTILNLASVVASPTSFNAERYADFVNSLGSQEALEGHLLVQRWTLDEVPMSRRLFEEVVEQLYREDRFMRGQLRIGTRLLGPSAVTAPLLGVYDPRSLIIPPESITAFHNAAGSGIKRLLPYHGDTGVALSHVGALVGRNAHAYLWPAILEWIRTTGATRH